MRAAKGTVHLEKKLENSGIIKDTHSGSHTHQVGRHPIVDELRINRPCTD